MKTEKMLEKLFEIKNAGNERERADRIEKLMEDLKADIVADNAKSAGRGSLHKIAAEILKAGQASDRSSLGYELTDGTAFYVCHDHRIMRYDSSFGFSPLPENVPGLAIKNIWDYQLRGERVPLVLPSVSDLDAWVKIKKAEKVKNAAYDLGVENIAINANYLLSALKNMDIVGAYCLPRGFLFEDRTGAQLVILGVRKSNQ